MVCVGQVIGRLTILERTTRRRSNSPVWLCVCTCGAVVEVSGTNLNGGYTRSCGCLKREVLAKRSRESAKHGHMRSNKASPTYQTWKNIIQRCENPCHTAYPHYGGFGIKVHPPWRISFTTFLSDVGERPAGLSLDRIDPSKGYEPGNCRWVTLTEQARNKRNNTVLSLNGETLVLAEWARRLGVSSGTITSPLNGGWSIVRALTEPRLNRKWAPRRSVEPLALRLERSQFKQRYRHLSGDLTYEQWQGILVRHNHCCAYCRAPKPGTMDHVIPLSRGGSHTASNVVPACRSCNSSKKAG